MAAINLTHGVRRMKDAPRRCASRQHNTWLTSTQRVWGAAPQTDRRSRRYPSLELARLRSMPWSTPRTNTWYNRVCPLSLVALFGTARQPKDCVSAFRFDHNISHVVMCVTCAFGLGSTRVPGADREPYRERVGGESRGREVSGCGVRLRETRPASELLRE